MEIGIGNSERGEKETGCNLAMVTGCVCLIHKDHMPTREGESLNPYMKLHSKLQFCHEGTQTQRDGMDFNLGALESLWLNE